jgi:hypothetical protein
MARRHRWQTSNFQLRLGLCLAGTAHQTCLAGTAHQTCLAGSSRDAARKEEQIAPLEMIAPSVSIASPVERGALERSSRIIIREQYAAPRRCRGHSRLQVLVYVYGL